MAIHQVKHRLADIYRRLSCSPGTGALAGDPALPPFEIDNLKAILRGIVTNSTGIK